MATFLFFLLFCAVNIIAAQQTHRNIGLGSSLTPTTNSSWSSPSGLYAFGFFPQKTDGYAVGVFIAGVPEKTVVWTANTDNPTAPKDAVLQLTGTGRLILQQSEGQYILDVVTTTQPIASASMLDNGNFVLYDSDSQIIWQSFDHPTNTLLPGQRLPPRKGLFSSASETDYTKGIFTLRMQTDGNLVQYPANGPWIQQNAYYVSNTFGNKNVSLNLEKGGYLYLSSGSSIIRNLTDGGLPTEKTMYLMRLDVGGVFRLYSRSLNPQLNWTVRWQPTGDTCMPKGICGLNAFCVQMDEDIDCKCLPGFDFVKSGNWTAGLHKSSVKHTSLAV